MSYKITIDKQGGVGGTDALWWNDGVFYFDAECTQEIESLTLPTKTGYTSNGCWSASSGGTKYVNAQGGVKSEFRSLFVESDITIYVQWSANFYKVTVDKQGGVGGTDEFYYRKDGGGFYADIAFTTPIAAIVKPARECFSFSRCYSAPNGEGTQYTGRSGSFLPALTEQTLTGNITIYVNWLRVSFKITIDKQGGVGGTDEFYYRKDGGGFYAEDTCETPISGITPPTKSLNNFKSLRSFLPNGTKYTNSTGTFESVFTQMEIDDDMTVYILWQTTYVTILIDKQGGAGGTSALYSPRGDGGIYAEPACETAVSSVVICARIGYTYTGTFTAAGGTGTKYISNAGNFINGFADIRFDNDVVIYVHWTASTYTLAFDYAGGEGGAASKSVTYGQQIGQLPAPTKSGAAFDGWRIDASAINATMVWNYAGDKTATAQWARYFGNVVDYFGLSSSSLKPISSNSGDNRQRICYSHTGKIDGGETSGVWRNPTVTYQVVRNCNLQVKLGAAFRGNGTSGYMITGVKVGTKIGQFPTVTVSATANEGANAINTFHLVVSLLGRARAQNLLGAVQGGGQLQSCSLQASCTPVVIAENNMPCASDIVGGKLTVTASTYAPNTEAAPTAGGSFTEVGVPKQCGDKDYLMWKFKAERDM